MHDPKLSIIVAVAHNNVIGIDNDLPWHIPEDLKRFKTLTTGKPVIMGRKTFESIYDRLGKPLPGRPNIVISRSQTFSYENVHMANDIDEAIDIGKNLCKNNGIDEFFCIGGAQIYSQLIPYADRIYLTYVNLTIKGDACFPEFDDSLYDLVENIPSEITTNEGDVLKYFFKTFERKNA